MAKKTTKKEKQSKDDFLALIKTRFKESAEAENETRLESAIDHRMENGDQWEESVLRDREGRPCVTVNKISGVVKQVIGDQRQNSPSIKVMPVDNDKDPDTAEIFTGIIRNIEQTSDADSAYDTAFFHQVVGSYGAWRINTEYTHEDSFDQDIVIKRIKNPHSVYFDPLAQEVDRSDARYCFVVDDMAKEDFESQYPKADISDWEDAEGENYDWITEDKVKVAEYFYKEPYTKRILQLETGEVIDYDKYKHLIQSAVIPEANYEPGQEYILSAEGRPLKIENDRESECTRVKWAKVTAAEVIDERTLPGKYIPVVFVPGEETFVDGRPVLRSAIRHARDSQRIYNWMSSVSIETIAQAPKQPWVATAEQLEGYEDQWAQAASKPTPYLLYNGVPGSPPPQRLGGSMPDTGALAEAQKASDDVKTTTGVYDASLGARGNETSGRAIVARQREGDTATFVFVDNLARALKYTGKILIDLIPKIYDTERIVRTLGPDGAEKFVKVNQMVADPSSPSGFKKVNDLQVGKYDVVVNVGPSYQTARVESAEAMLGIVQAVPQVGQYILDLVAKNMDWPGADEIEARLKKLLPQGMSEEQEELTPEQQQQKQQAMQQQQQMEQMQQQMVQLEMGLKQAELQGKQIDNQGKQQDMQPDQLEMQGQQLKNKGQQLDNQQAMLDMKQQISEMRGDGEKIAQQAVISTLQQLGLV